MMLMLRKAVIAVLFSILIAGFALWGVDRDFIRGQLRQPVAKVGPVEVSAQQFQATYQRTLRGLSSRAGRAISAQQAQAFGLPQGVLQSMIQEAAFDAEAQRLGLSISQSGIDRIIMGNKAFQDEGGKYSPERFTEFLARAGYSSQTFLAEIRSDLIRRQLRGQLERSAVVPAAMVEAYNRFDNEERELTYFYANEAAVGPVAAPSPEVLSEYFKARTAQFVVPERRAMTVVVIAPETVRPLIKIEDADIKAAYDAKPEAFAVPEKRKVELIPFQTRKAADEAAAALADGKDFLDVAKSVGFKQTEIDLSLVSKKEFVAKTGLPDAAADAVFSLEKGKTSGPIEGPLAVGIARVLEVIPAVQKTFDEVKASLSFDLQQTRTAQEVSRLTKAFEDDRQQGVPLADAAKKLNIPVVSIDTDIRGFGPDGRPANVPGASAAAIADAAFKSDVGVENQALRLKSNGYAWFDVTAITKSRPQTFDEAKATAEASWKADQLRDKIAEKSRDLVARITKGEKIAEAAKNLNAELKTSKPVKRTGNAAGLTAGAIAQAFSVAQDGVGSAVNADGASRTIFQVSKIITPPPASGEAAEAIRQRLVQSVAEDNVSAFVSGIKERLGSSVDVKQVLAGGGAAESEGADE